MGLVVRSATASMSFVAQEDAFGRSVAYTLSSASADDDDKTQKREANNQRRQHHQAEGMAAADIWNNFCQAHWPELYNHQHETAVHTAARVDCYEKAATMHHQKQHVGTLSSFQFPLSKQSCMIFFCAG